MFLFAPPYAGVLAKPKLEWPPEYRMKVHLGLVVTTAGICGILSFVFLATSLGTDYWYIIEMHPAVNMSDLNSHSGLWSTHEGAKLGFSSSNSLLNTHTVVFLNGDIFFFKLMSRREDVHRLYRLFHSRLLQVLRG